MQYGIFRYRIINSQVFIDGCVQAPAGDLIIPERIDGLPVTYISGFDNQTGIKSVSMPSVNEVGITAFARCANLETVYMPNVREVEMEAFWDCKKLKQVSWDNVRYIKQDAFANCISLQRVTATLVALIGKGAFSGCTSLYEVDQRHKDLPSSMLRLIDSEAFFGCSSLAQIIFAGEAPCVGKNAFTGCSPNLKFFIPAADEEYNEVYDINTWLTDEWRGYNLRQFKWFE